MVANPAPRVVTPPGEVVYRSWRSPLLLVHTSWRLTQPTFPISTHSQGRRWTAWGVEPPSCGCRRPAPLPQSVPRTGRVHPCWGWKAAAGQRLSLPVDVALTPQRVSVLEVCRAGGSDKGATPSRRAKAGGRTWWKGCRAPPRHGQGPLPPLCGVPQFARAALEQINELGVNAAAPPTRDGSAGHPDGGHWLQGARPAARHLLSVSFRVATA